MNVTTSAWFLAVLPEVALIVLAAVLILLGMLKRDRTNRVIGCVTAGGMLLIIGLAFLFSRPGAQGVLIWGGMLRQDSAVFLFRILFLAGGGLTAIFSCTENSIRRRPEFYILLVISTLGMSLMAAAADLIMLFLSIETASIPLYVMAGIKIKETRSVEAGLKYFLFGAMSSAILVYGFSLLYGFAGTTQIYDLASGVALQNVPLAALVIAIVFVLAGFAFKISAAPFHFWAPDVYEGAPTSVTGFLSTVSKAAGFAALMRILLILFAAEHAQVWQSLVAALAVASMFTGNLIAIPQKNIKRMLAYSSIAQAGYILVGLADASRLGYSGAIYYLLAYLATNLALFALVGWVEGHTGSDQISAFSGLHRRAPGLAFAMLIGLLSLGGIPPFAGFFAKLLVFGAVVEAGWAWLAVVGVLNSVIGLYYYLRVLKVMYMEDPLDPAPLKVQERLWLMGMLLCLVTIVVLGVILNPWFGFSSLAANSL